MEADLAVVHYISDQATPRKEYSNTTGLIQQTPSRTTTPPRLFVHHSGNRYPGDAPVHVLSAPWTPATLNHCTTGRRNQQNWHPNWEQLPPPYASHALDPFWIHNAAQQNRPLLPGQPMRLLPQTIGCQPHPGTSIHREGWQDLPPCPRFPIQEADCIHRHSVNGNGPIHNPSGHHPTFSPSAPRQLSFACAPFNDPCQPAGFHHGTLQAGLRHGMQPTVGFQPPLPTCSPNNRLLPAQRGPGPFPPTPPRHPPIHPTTPPTQQSVVPIDRPQYRLEDTWQSEGYPSNHHSLAKPSSSKAPYFLEQKENCSLSKQPTHKETAHKSYHLAGREIQSRSNTCPMPANAPENSLRPLDQRVTTKSPGNKRQTKVTSSEHVSTQKSAHRKNAKATTEPSSCAREAYSNWLNCVKSFLDTGEAIDRLGEPLHADVVEHLLGHALTNEVLGDPENSLPLATTALPNGSTAATNHITHLNNNESYLAVSAVHMLISTDVRTKEDFCYQKSLSSAPASLELAIEQTASNSDPPLSHKTPAKGNHRQPPGFEQVRTNSHERHCHEEDAPLEYKPRSGCREAILPLAGLWNRTVEKGLSDYPSGAVSPLQTLSSSLEQSFEAFARMYISNGDIL